MLHKRIKKFKYQDDGKRTGVLVSGQTVHLLKVIGQANGLTVDKVIQALAHKHIAEVYKEETDNEQ